MSESKPLKRQRTFEAIHKLQAIKRFQGGETKAFIARDIGVPESTLRGWCKNVDKINRQVQEDGNPVKRQRVTSFCSDEVQDAPLDLSLKHAKSEDQEKQDLREKVVNLQNMLQQYYGSLLCPELSIEEDSGANENNEDDCFEDDYNEVDEAIAHGERFLDLLQELELPYVSDVQLETVQTVIQSLKKLNGET